MVTKPTLIDNMGYGKGGPMWSHTFNPPTSPIVTWMVRPTYGDEGGGPRTFGTADELAALIRDAWDGKGNHSYCYEGIRYSVHRLIDGIIDPEWKPEA